MQNTRRIGSWRLPLHSEEKAIRPGITSQGQVPCRNTLTQQEVMSMVTELQWELQDGEVPGMWISCSTFETGRDNEWSQPKKETFEH